MNRVFQEEFCCNMYNYYLMIVIDFVGGFCYNENKEWRILWIEMK